MQRVLSVLLVFHQHFSDDILGILFQILFFFFIQFIRIDWFSIFQDYMSRLDQRQMILKNFGGVAKCNGHNGAIAFCGNLKASLVKREHFQFRHIFRTGSFRENADGYPVFDTFRGGQNGFHPLPDILTVEEQAVKPAHPGVKQYIQYTGEPAHT